MKWLIIAALAWWLFLRQPQASAGNRGVVVGDGGWLSHVDSIVANVRGLFGGGSGSGSYGGQKDGSYTIPDYEDQGTVGGDTSADTAGDTL